MWWLLAIALALPTVIPQHARTQGVQTARQWRGYAHDVQHTGVSDNASFAPELVYWSTPVDLDPQYSGNGDLYIHYGSPVITQGNVVVIPVKTGAGGGFRVEARLGTDGSLFWELDTDYALPPHNWTPPMGITLTAEDQLVAVPGAGGTVITRAGPDHKLGKINRLVFYGSANYAMNPNAFNAAIQICTPITCDRNGNLYFGYISSGVALPGYPAGIPSGLARISAGGVGHFVPAASLCGDNSIQKVAYNCAPALSHDETKLYVAVNNVAPSNSGAFGAGYLCMADSTSLGGLAHVLLMDPHLGGTAVVTDDSSATPTVGPDGDVYYGVIEQSFPSNHARGWLLHFDGALTRSRTPGAFGWDDTASIVPASAAPLYKGTSTYLVLTKYNNYADGGIGGNGLNRIAVLDPNAPQVDPITGATVMKEVMTQLGPTPNDTLPGVREWCINAAAIDTLGKCAVVNSEDGHVYRWDFKTNRLSPGLHLAPPTGEAYTPTVIGPDGSIYAINNSALYCCGVLHRKH
jgi:hypothetical protein